MLKLFADQPSRTATRVKPVPTKPIEVQIMGSDSLDVLRAKDVSVSGIGVRVPHRFAGCDILSEVELVITLPGGRPFIAQGVVRHSRLEGSSSDFFGIEFTSISDDNLDRIRGYVEQRQAEKIK